MLRISGCSAKIIYVRIGIGKGEEGGGAEREGERERGESRKGWRLLVYGEKTYSKKGEGL